MIVASQHPVTARSTVIASDHSRRSPPAVRTAARVATAASAASVAPGTSIGDAPVGYPWLRSGIWVSLRERGRSRALARLRRPVGPCRRSVGSSRGRMGRVAAASVV